jgi:hypothetical protein
VASSVRETIRVVQGKLDIAALRAVTGRIDAQLAIFTEDIFSADWLRTVLRTYGRVALEAVQVYGLQGTARLLP